MTPIITGPGSYVTREGKRVEVIARPSRPDFPWCMASDPTVSWKASGSYNGVCECSRDIVGTWIEISVDERHYTLRGVSPFAAMMQPSRLALAKAALEAARARRKANERADAELVEAAFDEVDEAEREAAPPPIPPALLEVISDLRECTKDSVFYPSDIIRYLARSHSIDPARLRDALEAGK